MSNRDDLNMDLSAIPGLGPVRRKALSAAGIDDLRGLLTLKVAELAEIRGIGLWQARKIREFLRHHGLLAEEDDEHSPAIRVQPPHTREEAEVVTAAAHALELQAEREAAKEAEVERLTEVVAEALHAAARPSANPDPGPLAGEPVVSPPAIGRPTPPSARPPLRPDGTLRGGNGTPPAPAERSKPSVSRAEMPAPSDTPASSDTPTAPLDGACLAAQRERLPDTATALMEAIREAAVSRRLARQLTRFLVVVSEFIHDQPARTDEQRFVASEAMSAVERLLERALERRRFSSEDQDDLADRIRRFRKHLERVLAAVETGDE